MSLNNLYSKDESGQIDYSIQGQYSGRIFVQGRRPHYYIDDSYTAVGRVFDTLQIVNDSTVTYTNELGGDGATAVDFTAGDIIYGLFEDTNITVAAGGLVRAYAAYPVQKK